MTQSVKQWTIQYCLALQLKYFGVLGRSAWHRAWMCRAASVIYVLIVENFQTKRSNQSRPLRNLYCLLECCWNNSCCCFATAITKNQFVMWAGGTDNCFHFIVLCLKSKLPWHLQVMPAWYSITALISVLRNAGHFDNTRWKTIKLDFNSVYST